MTKQSLYYVKGNVFKEADTPDESGEVQLDLSTIEVDWHTFDLADFYFASAEWEDGTELTDAELVELEALLPELLEEAYTDQLSSWADDAMDRMRDRDMYDT